MINKENYETIPAEEDKFPLRLRRYSATAQFPMHWHGHAELLYFTKGGATIYCGGEDYLAQDGDLIIVNPNELHRGDSYKEGVDYLCLLIPAIFFDWIGGDERYIFRPIVKSDKNIKRLVLNLSKSFEEKKDGYRYYTISCAYELIAYLAENYAAERLDKTGYAARNSKLESFNNVIEYIDKNYAQPLTTSKVASLIHLSECYFCHLFKKHIGTSFTSYLNEIRVRNAAVLLKNTNMSITEISAEAGFNDVNYFCRMFKRFEGVSPKQYKNS